MQSAWDPTTEKLEDVLKNELNIDDEDLINSLKKEEDAIRELVVSNAELIAANNQLEATIAKQIAHDIDKADNWTEEEEDLIGRVVEKNVTEADKEEGRRNAEKWSSGNPQEDKKKAEEWLKMTYGEDALENYRITNESGNSFTI